MPTLHLSITATYKAPLTLAKNSFTAAVFQLTNSSSVTSFLGAPGWTLNLTNQFHTDLMRNFMLLQQYQTQDPSLNLFPSGGTSPSAIKYAIWSYAAIIK